MLAESLEIERGSEWAALAIDLKQYLELDQAGDREKCSSLQGFVDRLDALEASTPAERVPEEWLAVSVGLRVLVTHERCLAIARGLQGDLVTEGQKHDVLRAELVGCLGPDRLPMSPALEVLRDEVVVAKEFDAVKLSRLLRFMPLPTVYWVAKEMSLPRVPVEGEDADLPPEPILRVIAFLDGAPVATPQLLRAELLYPLVFRVRGLGWPEDAERLRLDLISTCPKSEYALSDFVLDRPLVKHNFEYEGELRGQIKFESAQSSVFDDLVFAVHGAFELRGGGLRDPRSAASIDSFHSYTGLRELKLRDAEAAFVLVSASTSGELVKRLLVAEPRLPAAQALTLFYLGEQAPDGPVLCDMRFDAKANPEGFEPVVSYSAEECPYCLRASIPVTMAGEHFSP